MENYKFLNKLIHRVYLSNYFISKSTLEVELLLYNNLLRNFKINKIVFVSGLARSGTTFILNKIFDTNNYSSLQYKNMPFLFMPNLWKNISRTELQVRTHNDGIMINSLSPEEFDEYFWKVNLDDSYITKDNLIIHELSKENLNQYIKYIKLICLANGKTNYLSKNNNNLLRVQSLSKIPNSTFFLLIREPLNHCSSLLKLHKKYSHLHKADKFSLEYFNFLGHHEFGLNHKSFKFNKKINPYNIDSLDYWLFNWFEYYSYAQNVITKNVYILFFEDIINKQKKVLDFVSNILNENLLKIENYKFQPSKYQSYNSEMLKKCNELYLILRKEQLKYL